jgi:hypothetical protein
MRKDPVAEAKLSRATRVRSFASSCATIAALLWLNACGGESETKGAAGAGPLPNVGMTCTNECMTGFVCERAGVFAGQCTAGCSSGAACQLLFPGTACFGEVPMFVRAL